MGRRKGVNVVAVTIRMKRPTRDQLTLEATQRGLLLGTFLREVLESYAPGVGELPAIEEIAKKLAATPVIEIDK